jgi:hypothetical protein
MQMQPPSNVNVNPDQRTGHYVFPKDHPIPTGDYYPAGGVCWPSAGIGYTSRAGVVLSAICETTTRILYITGQETFLSVAHITKPGTNHIEYAGCCEFFNRVYANWLCRRYYYDQSDPIHEPFELETYRCALINPKPIFLIPDIHAADAVNALRLMLSTGRLKYRRDSMVHDQLRDFDVSGDAALLPAVHALLCLIAAVATLG